jgi:hypothetical protein
MYQHFSCAVSSMPAHCVSLEFKLSYQLEVHACMHAIFSTCLLLDVR